MPAAPYFRNGAPAASLGARGWSKPWSATNGGCCLEARRLAGGQVAIRQSADPAGPALVFTTAEIAAFVAGARAGLAGYLTEDR